MMKPYTVTTKYRQFSFEARGLCEALFTAWAGMEPYETDAPWKIEQGGQHELRL
jgi:hypothetical protein